MNLALPVMIARFIPRSLPVLKALPGLRLPLLPLALAATTFVIPRAEAQTTPAFVFGAEPIYVPNEMPAKLRTWHPTNQMEEAGIKRGAPFEAALVRVFNEDTDWSREMAVFRFRDGSVRAWKSRSFSTEDVRVMHEMRAKYAVVSPDARTWITKLDDETQKLVAGKTLNQYDTRHFTFIWGTNPDEEIKEALNSPRFIEKAGDWFEKVWSAYEVDFRAPMPHAGEPHPQRIIVKLYHTGIPGLGNSWANSAEEMWLDPRAMLYGSVVVGHEFGHVVQFYSGGFRIRSSGGAWWETHAENASFNYSPSYSDQFPVMFANLSHGCQWTESRYSNWAILMQLWEKKRTRHLVFGIWTQNRRTQDGASLEDPLETTVRLGQADGSLPHGWDSFGEEIGEMAARMVTMDYINQGYLCDATVNLRKKAISEVTPDETAPGWFKAPAAPKLYAYGIQWIPVTPRPGASQLSVSFRGRSKDNEARWKLTLVAVDKNNVARYSPRLTAVGQAEVKLDMTVKPGEDYFLALAATPAKYRSLAWDQIPEFDYPYTLRASDATLPVAH